MLRVNLGPGNAMQVLENKHGLNVKHSVREHIKRRLAETKAQ